MLGVAAQRIVHAIRKPRNNADEAIAAKPGGTGLSGRSAVSRRSPMGVYHWLRVASCISSRKASVATTRDLCGGSLPSAPAKHNKESPLSGRGAAAPVRGLFEAGSPPHCD